MSHRKPTDLKLLQGNPGKAGDLGQVATSKTGRPMPPADLKGEAFAEWARVVNHLEAIGHIENVDRAALVVYVTAWDTYNKAREILEDHGPIINGKDGQLVKNPAHQVMRDSSDTMLKYAAKFGLTPKDRQNMGLAAGGDEPADGEDLFAV
jgi:P27 family predicted phage terminase small subunit